VTTYWRHFQKPISVRWFPQQTVDFCQKAFYVFRLFQLACDASNIVMCLRAQETHELLGCPTTGTEGTHRSANQLLPA